MLAPRRNIMLPLLCHAWLSAAPCAFLGRGGERFGGGGGERFGGGGGERFGGGGGERFGGGDGGGRFGRCSGGSAGLGAGGVESLSVQRQASCLYVSLMLLGSFTLPVVLS
jgi:hypothetical protein